jgi:Zn-dependent alcohol dehydrogenase
METVPISTPNKGQVAIRMVAAPISYVDYSDIIGSRPRTLPSVGGNEGVGVVEKVGEGVSLSVGDWVVPNSSEFGKLLLLSFEY